MPRTTERPWYGPLSPWVTDDEKNEAVNRIERALALRAIGRHAEARAAVRGEIARAELSSEPRSKSAAANP